MTNRRAWGGDEWQAFALKLVQLRHTAQNVQIVPDAVKGDAGIEFFTTDGCLYQCYAPEEVSDVAKAASAMKAKAGRDIPKLEKNETVIAGLLAGLKVDRWILLCPFLDDKAVVADVRRRGGDLRGKGLGILTPTFEALVHSQDDFTGELEQLRNMSRGAPLSVVAPTAEEVAAKAGGEISQRISEKLQRAFRATSATSQIDARRSAYIRAHLYRENTLEQLRLNHPDQWEKSLQCLDAEEQRLVSVGTDSIVPAEQLNISVQRIEASLKADLPSLPAAVATQIAIGTVSDWLIRCPLDFPEGQ